MYMYTSHQKHALVILKESTQLVNASHLQEEKTKIIKTETTGKPTTTTTVIKKEPMTYLRSCATTVRN